MENTSRSVVLLREQQELLMFISSKLVMHSGNTAQNYSNLMTQLQNLTRKPSKGPPTKGAGRKNARNKASNSLNAQASKTARHIKTAKQVLLRTWNCSCSPNQGTTSLFKSDLYAKIPADLTDNDQLQLQHKSPQTIRCIP